MPLPQGSETVSTWMTTDIPRTETLNENISADVCIVGAGIAGLTTAYLLALEGKKVCVLEMSEIGGGQTGRTTAHFATSVDDSNCAEPYVGWPKIPTNGATNGADSA